LRGSRACDGNQRFTGGVGDQMKMKIAGVGHLYSGRMTCGQEGRNPRDQAPCKRAAADRSIFVHIADRRVIPAQAIRTPCLNVECGLGTRRDNASNANKTALAVVDGQFEEKR
jgi:hypothetical protein